jgi:hypothetical protein
MFNLKAYHMKFSLILLLAFFVSATQTLFAQEEITDEVLQKYAVTMDSIDDMKETLLANIANKVGSNESMTNERYNELSKIIDDETKLTETAATPEEIAFVREVAQLKADGTAEISKTFQTLAKEYVGASEYNQIKKALKTDASLKSRYETMMTALDQEENQDAVAEAN